MPPSWGLYHNFKGCSLLDQLAFRGSPNVRLQHVCMPVCEWVLQDFEIWFPPRVAKRTSFSGFWVRLEIGTDRNVYNLQWQLLMYNKTYKLTVPIRLPCSGACAGPLAGMNVYTSWAIGTCTMQVYHSMWVYGGLLVHSRRSPVQIASRKTNGIKRRTDLQH